MRERYECLLTNFLRVIIELEIKSMSSFKLTDFFDRITPPILGRDDSVAENRLLAQTGGIITKYFTVQKSYDNVLIWNSKFQISLESDVSYRDRQRHDSSQTTKQREDQRNCYFDRSTEFKTDRVHLTRF